MTNLAEDFFRNLLDARVSRRMFIGAMAALAIAPKAFARSTPEPVKVVALNHTVIRASDPARSVEWFQGLFGMPKVAEYNDATILRVGEGPQFLSILNEAPESGNHGVVHIGFAVEGFDPDDFAGRLRALGFAEGEAPGASRFAVITRGPENGGAPEGTKEVIIGDPDGLLIHIVDTSYSRGGGRVGNISPASYRTADSPIKLMELNHCTLGVSNYAKSDAFYKSIFRMPIEAYQGASAVYRIGRYGSIVLFPLSSDPATAKHPPVIDHTCYAVEDYDFNVVRQALTEYGLEDLGDTFRGTGPLQHYYTSRRPDRGGAPRGSFEIYFTDPDGTVFQLQDYTYCGGGGTHGEICGTEEHPSR